jgi:hypothetical protein
MAEENSTDSNGRRTIRIRVRSGESEAEIETSLSSIHEAIELIPQVLAKLPPPPPNWESRRVAAGMVMAGASPPSEAVPMRRQEAASAVVASAPSSAPSAIPLVTVEKGDSLSDVISKFFGDLWGRSPRKLMDVREALQSYGLNYPKQSVAVALLRLAKASKIRRFKGEGGEYVYTASMMGAVRISASLPSGGATSSHMPEGGQQQQEEEEEIAAIPSSPDHSHDSSGLGTAPADREEEEEEEQLNLDAPSTN